MFIKLIHSFKVYFNCSLTNNKITKNEMTTYIQLVTIIHLRIDRNFCSVHEEITSVRLYTPCNPRSGIRKGVYNLIEVISNEPNK